MKARRKMPFTNFSTKALDFETETLFRFISNHFAELCQPPCQYGIGKQQKVGAYLVRWGRWVLSQKETESLS